MKSIVEILNNLFADNRGLDSEAAIRERMAETKQRLDALANLPSPDPEQLASLVEQRNLLTELQTLLDARAGWEKLVRDTPIPTAAQIRAVGEEAFWQAPDDVRQKIAALQKQYETECASMLEFLPRKAGEAFEENRAAILKGIISGDGANVREGWTKADFEQDFRLKLDAHKLAIKRLSVAAHELVKPCIESFDLAVAEYAERLEASERTMAEVFCLKFNPSEILLLIHKVRVVVRQQFSDFHPNSGTPPKHIAAIILG